MSSGIANILKSNLKIKDAWQGILDYADARMVNNRGLRKKMGIKTIHAGYGEYELGGKNITFGATGNGFGKDVSNATRLKSMYYNKDGSLSKKAVAGTVAGSYLGLSAAGRIATGGGLYKDSDGNTDLIGVPFI